MKENRLYPPHQRLYEDAKVKDDQLINMKIHLDRVRAQTDLTHRPRLNGFASKPTRPLALRPLHERVPDILKDQDLKRRMEEKVNNIERIRSFSSTFNNHDTYISSNKDPVELLDVATRLLMRGKQMDERRLHHIQEAEERLSQTIHPPMLLSRKVTEALIVGNPDLR